MNEYSMNPEQFYDPELQRPIPEEQPLSDPELREILFLSYVNERLLETFEEALWELPEMSEEKILEWKKALSTLDDERLNAFLAIPHEVMRRRIEALSRAATHTKLVDVVAMEASHAFECGHRVAYHCSHTEQNPRVGTSTNTMEWTIDGREPDHRDNDVGMAYYSLDLAHLYRSKRPNYVYLVRADVRDDGTHKRDDNGAWGRAPKLDVITRVNFQEAMSEVEQRAERYRAKEKQERRD
jgi:hypothetical protein